MDEAPATSFVFARSHLLKLEWDLRTDTTLKGSTWSKPEVGLEPSLPKPGPKQTRRRPELACRKQRLLSPNNSSHTMAMEHFAKKKTQAGFRNIDKSPAPPSQIMREKPCDSRSALPATPRRAFLMPRLVAEALVPCQSSGRLYASTPCPNLLQQHKTIASLWSQAAHKTNAFRYKE